MVARTGMMAVPTAAVDNEFAVGFDRDKPEKLLH